MHPASLSAAPRKSLGREMGVKFLRAQQSAGLKQRTDALGIALFVLLIVLLAFRITRGADFSDESYYAIFIDDWLKGSIATSTFLTIHQTAALIVYPAALLYAKLTGSSDGLFLFLRVLFLIGAVLSALCWVVFLKRLGHRLLAWAGGILVLGFIPFGLPAPSYNTLGQQALAIALASYGCAALIGLQKREQLWWLVVSACAWMVATISYPSIIMPLGALCLSSLCYRDGLFPRPPLFLALIGVAICAGWSLVALSLTPARFFDCLAYSSATFDPKGWSRRLAFVRDTFAANKTFSILGMTAIIIGLARQRFPLTAQLATVAVVVLLFALPPTLYARSHDAITLAALSGLGLLTGLRTGASRSERVVGLVYATSLIAALITCGTAYNTIFNFSIGAVPAATLAMVGRPVSKPFHNIANLASISVAIAAVLTTSLFFYYGELPGQPYSPRERIVEGFFSGLALVPNDAALIHLVQRGIDPLLKKNQSVVFIGRMPGLVLATPARLSMPIPYPIPIPGGENLLAMAQAFYELPGRRPSLLLIYRDAYFTPINPVLNFDDRYASEAELKTPLGSLSIFRRR